MSVEIVNLNGRLVRSADARVSVLDRGLLFAESVWETVRVYTDQAFLLGPHFRRLSHAAQQIGIGIPWSLAQLRHEIQRTVAANHNDLAMRIVVTAGPLIALGDGRRSTTILMPRPASRPAGCEDRGVRLTIVANHADVQRSKDPTIKSGNYLPNVLAAGIAASRGALEAILLNGEGHVTECAQSNLFMVRNGHIETPHEREGLLPGITRELVTVLAARRLGTPVTRGTIEIERLLQADEVFMTGSVKEVVGVTAIDQTQIGDGQIGPVTRALGAHYREVVERFIATGDEPEVIGPWDRTA